MPARSGTGTEFRDDARRVSWLTAETVKKLNTIDPVKSWCGAFETVAILAIAIAALIHWWTPWVVIPAIIVITGRQRNFDAASNRRVLALVESTVDEFASSIVTDLTVTYGSPTLLIESAEQRIGVAPESSDRASWRAVLINAPGLRGGSVLTAGAWPSAEAGEGGPGQLTIEAAIDEVAAEAFGISVGDVVVVAPFWDEINDSIEVRISGVYFRGDSDPQFWSDIDGQFGLDDRDLSFLPLIPDPGAFEREVGPFMPGMAVRYFWRFHVDSTLARASGADALLQGFDDLKIGLQSQIGSYLQSTPLRDVLARNQQQTFFSRLPMTVVFSVIAAVVLYFVAMMSILMVETQRDDISRLRTRAATARQVVGAFVVEGAVISLLAVAIAPPVAALLVKWIGVVPLFSGLNDGNPLPSSLGQSAYIVSALTGVGGFIAMVFPASMAAGRTVMSSVRESTRPTPQGVMQKYYLDVALFGLLLVFASQLTSDGSFVDVPGVGAAQIDRINVAMPALVLAFGGFVALRAFPVFVELVARITSLPRISGLVSPAITLVLWQMARNPRHYSRLSLLMILTAGLGVFASSFAGTLDVSAADRARYQSGADLRINGISYTNRIKAGELFTQIAKTDGISSAAPAFRAAGVDITAEAGSTFSYLGVDPVPMADIAWSRADFSSDSLGEQMALFRDGAGTAHAIGALCPHRGTDLGQGRAVDGAGSALSPDRATGHSLDLDGCGGGTRPRSDAFRVSRRAAGTPARVHTGPLSRRSLRQRGGERSR